MKKIICGNFALLVIIALNGTIMISAGTAHAAGQEQTKQQIQTQMQEQEQIYGSQLMTEQERTEYSARMRSAKTAEEREKIRAEHHEHMKQRAKEKGITLPDEPPELGMGRGMGPGGGGGMGKGGPKR